MREVFSAIVHPWLLDSMGHLTTRYYMAIFDDASLSLLARATGWRNTGEDWSKVGWADVRHEIEYLQEVEGGSFVVVRAEVVRIGNKSIDTRYEMIKGGTVVAKMSAKSVYFDLVARQGIAIPPEMRERATEFLAAV